MRLSKERKLLLSILGLGLIALAGDQFFSAPSTAVAAGGVTLEALEQESASDAPAVAVAKVDAPRANAGPSFALRLVAAAGNHGVMPDQVRDGFTPGSAWKIAKPVAQEKPEIVPDDAAKKFAENCRPQLVLRAAGRAVVRIGGKHYRVGDSVDGWLVTAIGRHSMTFANGSDVADVTLPEPTASRSADNGRQGSAPAH